MSHPTSRRQFIKTSAAVGAGFFIASRSDAADSASPNEQVSFACVGVGGKGDSDSDHVSHLGKVVAICDIDDRTLDRAGQKYKDAKKFYDFREMFDKMGDQIDATTVSTPDHCHAVVAMMAMKRKKHVYCQKPMTHSIFEARALQEAARKYGVQTQMGNQGTSMNDFRTGVEVIQSGVLGPIHEVHVWTNRPIWPQAPQITERPKGTLPIPSYLHWDNFLGPAPERPFNNGYQPFVWRGWRDFGTGALGDMGCHTVNLPFMGLNLGFPTSVMGEGGDINPETYPSWATVVYEFPARGDMPPVKLTWWEGHKHGGKRNIPEHNVTKGFDLPESGSLTIGEHGAMMSLSDYGDNQRLIFSPSDTPGNGGFKGLPPVTLPRIGGGDQEHKKEWVDAIKGKGKPMSNFDYAGKLTETILLGNIAIVQERKKLEWDGPGMKFTNNDEANQMISYKYRDGYALDSIA